MSAAVLHLTPQSRWKLAGVPLWLRAVRSLARRGVTSLVLILEPGEKADGGLKGKLKRHRGLETEIVSPETYAKRAAEWSSLPSYRGNELLLDGRTLTVENRGDLAQATAIFYDYVKGLVQKPTDGFILRHLNRKLSGPIARLMVWTPVSANAISVSVALLGFLAAWLVSRGNYAAVAVGGLVFQISAIVDAVDGEVAHLKQTNSKTGQWVDTVCDNVSYAVFLFGVYLGVVRQGSLPYAQAVGLLTVFGLLLTLGHMVYYLLKFTNSGSLVTVASDLNRDLQVQKPNILLGYLLKIRFMMRRDFFTFFLMALCLCNLINVILVLAAFGTNMTWIVLRTMKKEFSVTKPAKDSTPVDGPWPRETRSASE